MLRDVREGFRSDEVRGRFDRRADALEPGVDGDRHGGPRSEGVQRDSEAALREDSRVDAAGEVSKLLDSDLNLIGRVAEQALLGSLVVSALCALQLEGESDEPLLGPVVEISLDPPALLVARRDDPGS